MSVDVSDFGAKGDGLTDDAIAINEAVSQVRRNVSRVEGYPIAPVLVFHAGTYLLKSPIDLTGIQALNLMIVGNGATLLAEFEGGAVLNALGARWLTIRDLIIIGSSVKSPAVGLQIGLLQGGIVADNHMIQNVKILGNFSFCCLYNRAAETTLFEHTFCWNKHPNSFCVVQDGLYHFELTGKVSNSLSPVEQHDVSFNENTFISCDFRHSHSSGIPVWLGDTSRHEFIGCYAAGQGQAAFVIYSGGNGHNLLKIDCHCETRSLQNAVLFDGSRGRVLLRGLRLRDHGVFASKFVLARTRQVELVELQAADLELGHFYSPDTLVFDDPQKWNVSGTVRIYEARRWNGPHDFRGTTYLGSQVSQAH